MRSLGDPKELEEERRLAYVGITRARERLYVSRAVTRSAWGSPAFNPPSRFWEELPPELIDWRRAEPVGRSLASGGFGSSPSTSSIEARVKRMTSAEETSPSATAGRIRCLMALPSTAQSPVISELKT